MTAHSQRRKWISRSHQVLISLNIAISSQGVVCLHWRWLAGRFYRLESAIMLKMHEIHLGLAAASRPLVEYSDFSAGYIAFWLPVTGLALCLWALFVCTPRTRATQEVLRSVGGFAGVFLLPAIWVSCLAPTPPYVSWIVGLFHRGAVIELAAAALSTSRVFSGHWPITAWWTGALVFLHFSYWLYMPNTFPHAAGPVPIVVGLCSTLLWGAYLESLRRDSSHVIPHGDSSFQSLVG